MDALRRAADGGTALDPAVVAKLLGPPEAGPRGARPGTGAAGLMPGDHPPHGLCVVPQASAAPRQVPTSR